MGGEHEVTVVNSIITEVYCKRGDLLCEVTRCEGGFLARNIMGNDVDFIILPMYSEIAVFELIEKRVHTEKIS